MHTILEVIVKIGIHIIITESGQTISVFQNFIKLPGFSIDPLKDLFFIFHLLFRGQINRIIIYRVIGHEADA